MGFVMLEFLFTVSEASRAYTSAPSIRRDGTASGPLPNVLSDGAGMTAFRAGAASVIWLLLADETSSDVLTGRGACFLQ